MSVVITKTKINNCLLNQRKLLKEYVPFCRPVNGKVLIYHAVLLLIVIILGENSNQNRPNVMF